MLLTLSLSFCWVDLVEFGVIFSSASVTRSAPRLLVERLDKGNFSYGYGNLYGMPQTCCHLGEYFLKDFVCRKNINGIKNQVRFEVRGLNALWIELSNHKPGTAEGV
jgi:hypothetical protein